MSILDSLARTRRESQPYRTPRLTVVPHPAFRPPRMPFVLLVLLLLGAGLVGLLLINTSLQQGSFTLHALRQQTSDLSDRQRSLQQQVAALEAPDHLAAKAGSLGMVANPSPAFLRLSDGAVLGNPVPATAPPVPPPATHAPDTAGSDTAAGDRRGAHDPKPAAKKPAATPKPETGGNGQSVRGDDAGPAGRTR